MKKPVVGVIGNAHLIENRFAAQVVGERNLRAVAEVTGALPVIFAGSPEITDIGARGKAIARVDNFVTFVSDGLPGDVAVG